MDCSKKLNECQCGTVIGCYHCKKSICEMSSLLNIPQSSSIIAKCKPLGVTATQPPSGKPHEVLTSAQKLHTGSFMAWVSTAEQLL